MHLVSYFPTSVKSKCATKDAGFALEAETDRHSSSAPIADFNAPRLSKTANPEAWAPTRARCAVIPVTSYLA
jgi:hypothetical protein